VRLLQPSDIWGTDGGPDVKPRPSCGALASNKVCHCWLDQGHPGPHDCGHGYEWDDGGDLRGKTEDQA
jgi:hypothetical protein